MLNQALNSGAMPLMPHPIGRPAQWAVSTAPVPYPEAVAFMQARVAAIVEGRAGELVWLLEHPPLYTAGVSSKTGDLLDSNRFPVFQTERGGQFTYHGPGQQVAYVMLDLRERGRDVRQFVQSLEAWIIDALAAFDVRGELRDGRVGVWVQREVPGAPSREDKIAAVGVRVTRWVSWHGVSLNVNPDLAHFAGIVPCGVTDHGVTSLADLGRAVTMTDARAALKGSFERVFGPATEVEAPIP